MKKYLAVFAVSIASLAAVEAHAASNASASATAEVYSPISITKTADLRFGRCAKGATAGTVVIDPDGSRSATGGVLLLPVGTTGPAAFAVSGDPNATFAVTITLDPVLIANVSNSIYFNTATSSAGRTLNSEGNTTLTVGATLDVPSNQVVGSYVGAIDVAVQYN